MKDLQQIIDGCITNDRRDQHWLYEKYYGYCLKIVFRYVFRYDKATDVVNDGFVKIFSKLHLFKCESHLSIEMVLMGWMRRIMINTAIDQLRKDNFLPEIGQISDNIWMEDHSRSADSNILHKELIKQIKKLPPGYRAVFNMYVIDGFSHQEIADRLHIAVGTSKSNLSKARVLLQKFIKKEETVLLYATGE